MRGINDFELSHVPMTDTLDKRFACGYYHAVGTVHLYKQWSLVHLHQLPVNVTQAKQNPQCSFTCQVKTTTVCQLNQSWEWQLFT